jgi:hypothetical protein
MRRIAIALTALVLPLGGAAQAATVEDVLAEAAAACTALDGGAFAPNDAVSRPDVTGDGQPDTVIDWGRFGCEKAASAYAGTGGAPLTVLVDGARHDMRSKGWFLLPTPPGPVLLMQVHGTECGGIGADPCFEAVIWNGTRFMSMRQP